MTFDELVATRSIRCQPSAIFQTDSGPKPRDFDFTRVEGMLLGLAIGDSLGAPTESMLPGDRRARYGEVRDYLPNRHTREARGFPTDDTQLAFWTLESLLEQRGFEPEAVAAAFATRRIFGLGSTVRAFLKAYKSGTPWHQSGQHSAGNGALMRIAPMIVPYLRSGNRELWREAAINTMITHNDAAAIASSVAFVALLWDLLDMKEAPPAPWWRERFVAVARDVAGDTSYRPRGGTLAGWEGSFGDFVEMALRRAERENPSVLEAGNLWYSGAYLLETVPSVLYILMRHAADPEEAMVRAVNDTKDNDTVAAIVGAAVGALHGRRALPQRWIEGLSGWTQLHEEGRVFELIEEAREVFWE